MTDGQRPLLRDLFPKRLPRGWYSEADAARPTDRDRCTAAIAPRSFSERLPRGWYSEADAARPTDRDRCTASIASRSFPEKIAPRPFPAKVAPPLSGINNGPQFNRRGIDVVDERSPPNRPVEIACYV